MTIQYTHKIAQGNSFLSFMRLLRRWQGSVYKVVWPDMLLYCIFYTTLSLIYRLVLSEEGRRIFENLVIHCARFRNLIPVSFVLGFYVSLVVSRWWETYQTFPWPDNLSILVTTHIPDMGEAAREVRTTIMRYCLLTISLTFSMVSPVVKKKISSFQDLLDEDYLTEEELKILQRLKDDTNQPVTWMPISWACRTVQRARQQGLVTTDLGYRDLVEEILKIRSKCGGLIGYDCNNIPLVYCQVVSIAVYSYFLFSVLGEQFLDPTKKHPDHNIDLYVPVFGLLQLFFYLGWMKVAEALLNPFGADDHDFDFVSLLRRHSKLSALLCDPAPEDFPSRLQHQEKPRPLPIFFPDETPDEKMHTTSCCRGVLRSKWCDSLNCEATIHENELQLQQAEERDLKVV